MKLISILLISVCFLAGFSCWADSGVDQIAVLTYLKLKPGTEERFMDAVNQIVKPSLAEPGNVAWYVQQSASDPTSIVFYTRWKSEDALQIHLKSKPIVDYIAQTAPLLEPGYPQLVRFHPIDQIRDDNAGSAGSCDDCSCCP